MADHTITISNNLNILGPTPASQWGTMEWGNDNWGESKDFSFLIYKCFSNSITFADTWRKQVQRTISNSVSATADMDLCCLQDGSGYEYYLPGGVTDPDDRNFPTYTEQSASDPGWTEDTENDPGWSEA